MVTISSSTLRQNQVDISKETLYKFYYDFEFSYQKIADFFGCCTDTICRRMKKYGFKPRNRERFLRGNRFAAGEKNHRWRGGSSQYWKNQLIEELGYKCEICCYDKIVQVHHIDENRKNDTRNNLMLLCPNCHYLTHHGGWVLINEDKKWSLFQVQL